MSSDGCPAGFSASSRLLFLDAKQNAKLDQLEIGFSVREAIPENLQDCPFCPYAEEYPAVEIQAEFLCRNPECMIVSCRACRHVSHLPLTCDEAKLEIGSEYVRKELEEAMSTGLIRKCNKCQHSQV